MEHSGGSSFVLCLLAFAATIDTIEPTRLRGVTMTVWPHTRGKPRG
jgi:hypothetical protein